MEKCDLGGHLSDRQPLTDKEKAEKERVHNYYKKLDLLKWLEVSKHHELNILSVWGNAHPSVHPNHNGETVSHFRFASGPKDCSHLITTTTGEELEQDYTQLYETMHDVVTAMVQVSPLLSKLNTKMTHRYINVNDGVTSTVKKMVIQMWLPNHPTWNCVRGLGGADNVTGITRTVENLKVDLLVIHKALLSGKTLNIENFIRYKGLNLTDIDTTDTYQQKGGQSDYTVFNNSNMCKIPNQYFNVRALAQFLEDITSELAHLHTILKGH